MSHRENSLTPWIVNGYRLLEPPPVTEQPEPTWDGTRWSDDDPKTEEEKHAYCRRRWGYPATYIPPKMYERGERLGLDMRQYVANKLLPEQEL